VQGVIGKVNSPSVGRLSQFFPLDFDLSSRRAVTQSYARAVEFSLPGPTIVQ